MEIYYSILNILDYYAKDGKELEPKMIPFLDYLAAKDNINISDISDANDCGTCRTWDELVKAMTELYKKGERV